MKYDNAALIMDVIITSIVICMLLAAIIGWIPWVWAFSGGMITCIAGAAICIDTIRKHKIYHRNIYEGKSNEK